MKDSPEEQALRALQEHQEAMGIMFDDPDMPVPPPLGSRDEEFR